MKKKAIDVGDVLVRPIDLPKLRSYKLGYKAGVAEGGRLERRADVAWLKKEAKRLALLGFPQAHGHLSYAAKELAGWHAATKPAKRKEGR